MAWERITVHEVDIPARKIEGRKPVPPATRLGLRDYGGERRPLKCCAPLNRLIPHISPLSLAEVARYEALGHYSQRLTVDQRVRPLGLPALETLLQLVDREDHVPPGRCESSHRVLWRMERGLHVYEHEQWQSGVPLAKRASVVPHVSCDANISLFLRSSWKFRLTKELRLNDPDW